MATGGETYKPGTREWYEAMKAKQAATAERKAKASFKQLVCWRKFRISGAAGFAGGALRSAANRLEALKAELPPGDGHVGSRLENLHTAIQKDINIIKDITCMVRHYRLQVMDLAELAERKAQGIENPPGDATYGTTNSGSA